MRTAHPDCERFQEIWVCDSDPGITDSCESLAPADRDFAEAHVQACPDCQQIAEKFAADQRLLSGFFAAETIPSPPPVALREPLHAASGYPRRVSLNVLPFLLILLLLALLAIGLAGWAILGVIDGT